MTQSASQYLIALMPVLMGAGTGLHPTGARAWGDLGHEVVCEIAFQELTPSARATVVDLIALDGQFRTFSKSCTWPDHPRIRAGDHFVNLPRDRLTFGDVPCPVSDTCVVSAILNDMRDLGLFEKPTERLRLLKSLGHWVGDLHQPLHVSFGDDRGGNRIDVGPPCDSNLHDVWDTCIIAETMGEDAASLAKTLRAEITQDDRSAWFVGNVDTATAIGWAGESLAAAIAPGTQYCVMDGTTCRFGQARVAFDGDNEKFVDANADYLAANAPVVRQRLKIAGVRLAGILNALLGESGTDAVVAHAPMSLQEVVAIARAAPASEAMEAGVAPPSQPELRAQIEELERARDLLTQAIDRLRLEVQ